MLHRSVFLTLGTLCGLIIPLLQAHAQDFKDVPPAHPAFTAIEDLQMRGILSGYPDGTFKPEKNVARSEAVKMIMAPLLAGKDVSQHSSSPYTDVPKGIWYLPYTEEARMRGVIDGPPQKTTFQGERTVLKAEFIKMLLKANSIDLGFLQDVHDPFAIDVQPSDWHASFMAYSVASSMLSPSSDWELQPGHELTRADAAVLLSTFFQYREGKRTQALLSAADREMTSVLQSFEAKNSRVALYAATTGLLEAKGAEQSRPETLTNGVVQLGEAFLDLAKGNIAGSVGQYAQSAALAGEAWGKAGKATEASATLAPIGQKVQDIAHTMAESARGH
ncbi:MAG: S-layer homology domain-containing protein [Patescibacteria group bacterium]